MEPAAPPQAAEAPAAPEQPRRLRIDFPPIKDKEEILQAQQAVTPQEEVRKDMEQDIPPIIRSVLELSHLMVSGHSQWLRATPGYEGGIFYNGSPYCFAGGFRDGTRPLDMDDKGNHMRLKDPLLYGHMSLPVTSAYLCELHGKGIFDLERPLAEYLPDLSAKLGGDTTARSVLSFTTVLDDAAVLRDAGARPLAPLPAWNACAATQKAVYEPINRFLAGGSSGRLNGRQQRENLVQYVRSAPRITGMLRRPLRAGRMSHFSVALLVAAVETQLKGVSFEESIRSLVFERAQSHGAGYGPPKLWRDPNEIFYQPSGLSMLHQGFKKPVPGGSLDNCGPPALNASLNLHAPVEDYGKLLMLSLDTIMEARELLGCPAVTHPYHDFGVRYVPGRDQLEMSQRVYSGIDFIPSAGSLRYRCDLDLGCFGIANCGTRSGRLFGNTLSNIIQHLFVKHAIGDGVEADKPVDLDNPGGGAPSDLPEGSVDPATLGTEQERKLQKVVKRQEFTAYFKNQDAHKRF